MKKILGILLAVVMIFLAAFAGADEVPQPEGGKKFETDWAVEGGIAEIFYEEEGYRVYMKIERAAEAAGSEYEYACYYHEDTDSLVSLSSLRSDYTINPDTGDEIYGDTYAYEGIDEEGKETEFVIDGDGFLIWKDGHDDAGAGLKFVNIGTFEGIWRNEEKETEAEFMFNGGEEGVFDYTVYIQRGKENADTYTLYLMTGSFDAASGKLTASGTGTVFTKNAAGEYETADSDESIEAVFSMTENGTILYESEGIELKFDLLGNWG